MWSLHVYFNIPSLVNKTSVDKKGSPWKLAENQGSTASYHKGICPVADIVPGGIHHLRMMGVDGSNNVVEMLDVRGRVGRGFIRDAVPVSGGKILERDSRGITSLRWATLKVGWSANSRHEDCASVTRQGSIPACGTGHKDGSPNVDRPHARGAGTALNHLCL